MLLARISYCGPGSSGPRALRTAFRKESISSSVVTSRLSIFIPLRVPYSCVSVVMRSGSKPGSVVVVAVVHRRHDALQLVRGHQDRWLGRDREHPRLVENKVVHFRDDRFLPRGVG